MKQLLVLGIMVLGINYLNAQTTVFTPPASNSNNTVSLNTFKYSICDPAGWIKMGTLTLPQQGNNAFIRMFAGSGYNAAQSQNGHAEIFIRTSNGSNGDQGKNFTAVAANYGQTKIISQIKIVHDNNTDLFDVYVYMGVYNGNGFYTVEAGAGSWVNTITSSCSTVSEPTVNVYNVPFEFRTQDDTYLANSLFARKSDGSVGVGTIFPYERLHVKGGGQIIEGNNPGIMFWNTNGSNDFQMGLASGTGAYNKFAKSGDFVMSKVNTDGHFFIGNQQGGDILFTTGASGWGSSQKVMTIFNDGKVGIGNTTPITGNYKLVVEGVIGAQKIKVTQLGWADYVFAPEYKLLPLQDLETYIKQHQHLPDVPSASEVAANGIDLGDNQAVLLKKIEELTLYVIEQEKQRKIQQAQIAAMQAEIKALKKQ